MKAWLGRSPAPGFSIVMHNKMRPIPPNPPLRTDEIWQPETVFKEVVAPNSRRLRSLTLMPSLQWDLIRSLPFDNLTTLILMPVFHAWDERLGELLSAPSLRSVSVFVYPTNFVPRLPWAQLTDLSIDGNYPAQKVILILAQCTSLELFGLDANIDNTTSLPVSGISLETSTSKVVVVVRTLPVYARISTLAQTPQFIVHENPGLSIIQPKVNSGSHQSHALSCKDPSSV